MCLAMEEMVNVPHGHELPAANWRFTTRGWFLAIIVLAGGLLGGQLLYGAGFRYIACFVVVGSAVASLWTMGLGVRATSTAALIGFFLVTPIGHEHVRGALIVLIWISMTISEYGPFCFFALLMAPGVAFAIVEILPRLHAYRRAIGYSVVAWFVAVWFWIWMQSEIPPRENVASIPFFVMCIGKTWAVTAATRSERST